MFKWNTGINKVRNWVGVKSCFSICKIDSGQKGFIYWWFHDWSRGKTAKNCQNHETPLNFEHLLLIFINCTIKNPEQRKLSCEFHWAFAFQFAACRKALHPQIKTTWLWKELVWTSPYTTLNFIVWRGTHRRQWYSVKDPT